MRFINLGLEEEQQATGEGEQGTDENTQATEETTPPVNLNPNEAEQAVQAVQNQDSTEPAKVLQVANYKEELAALRAANKDDDTNDTSLEGDTSLDTSGDTADSDTNADGGDTGDVDSGDDSDDTDEAGESSSTEEKTEEEPEEPAKADAELGEEAPGKSDEQVAQEQYIVEGYKKVHEALESISVMSKFHGLLDKKTNIAGIERKTALVIKEALETHSATHGYVPTGVPALEDFEHYTQGIIATRELKISVEGFLETTWNAIKKFFKSVWTWIIDLLNGSKDTGKKTTIRPRTPDDRDKKIDFLLEMNKKLEDSIKSIDKQREKDEARNKKAAREELSKSIASCIFNTNDKGSFSEILANAKELATVVKTAEQMSKDVFNIIKIVSLNSNKGAITDPSSMALVKENYAGLSFDKLDRTKSSAVYEAVTDEIVGGLAVRFIFAGTDLDSVVKVKSMNAVVKELSTQGYKVVSTKKQGQFPTTLPSIDQNDIGTLKGIVSEIKKMYGYLNNISNTITSTVAIVKNMSQGQQPASWQNLTAKDIAVLQAQANFIGLIDVSLAAGYESLCIQIDNYVNGNEKLSALLIT